MAVTDIKIIKSEKQYNEYCDRLWKLINESEKKNKDEIELLKLLTDHWANSHMTIPESDPVQLLTGLLEDKNIKQIELAEILGISKSAVSQILNYRKGMSKEVIRKLADFFKLSHEAFNRPYPLIDLANKGRVNSKVMNTKKDLGFAS